MNNITIHQIGCLAVRAIVLLFAMGFLAQLSLILSGVFSPDGSLYQKFLIVLSFVAHCAFIYFVWIRAPWVASKMLSGSQSESVSIPFSVENIQIVMLVAVGFLILERAMGPFVSVVWDFFFNPASYGIPSLDRILSPSISLVISLLLILSPKGIVRIIQYVRTVEGSK
ncbi:MAG: hypothetical protein ACK4NR_03360 [Micavibrio sp.]